MRFRLVKFGRSILKVLLFFFYFSEVITANLDPSCCNFYIISLLFFFADVALISFFPRPLPTFCTFSLSNDIHIVVA
jgi:hypothetical protein